MITPPFRPLPAAFQSTHPLRGATQHHRGDRRERHISIHAPLAGCDRNGSASRRGCRHFNPRTPCGVRHRDEAVLCDYLDISIHAPLAGCDADRLAKAGVDKLFQSTHPLRGATCQARKKALHLSFQSTHPLRGATPDLDHGLIDMLISIHAPLAGCDQGCFAVAHCDFISIHAPLAGCDVIRRPSFHYSFDFNPRTPCGVRHNSAFFVIVTAISIHAPLAGCDTLAIIKGNGQHISIHAPLAGCDASRSPLSFETLDFNPRTPCGVRRY